MPTRFFAGLSLFFLSCTAIFADEEPGLPTEPPPYTRMMVLNGLIPGYAQFQLGQTDAGWAYLSALPLGIAGQGLLLYYYTQGPSLTLRPTEGPDGQTVLIPQERTERQGELEWMLHTGITLTVYSSLLSAYSSWSAHRDWTDEYVRRPRRRGRETLWELVSAPYRPENLLTGDFFPMFPLTLVTSLRPNDLERIGTFFGSERVDFWGSSVTPAAGLALNTVYSLILVAANAASEEILFRGLSLETSGAVYSSLSFGLAHLPNALIPNIGVEETLLQTAFATLFGFYAADRTLQNDYRFGPMVALHYWHNVGALGLNYLTQAAQAEGRPFTIRFSLRY